MRGPRAARSRCAARVVGRGGALRPQPPCQLLGGGSAGGPERCPDRRAAGSSSRFGAAAATLGPAEASLQQLRVALRPGCAPALELHFVLPAAPRPLVRVSTRLHARGALRLHLALHLDSPRSRPLGHHRVGRVGQQRRRRAATARVCAAHQVEVALHAKLGAPAILDLPCAPRARVSYQKYGGGRGKDADSSRSWR